MSQLTLAIIIFVIHLALYITNVIPMTVTALLTSAACLLCGLTTQAESFDGFADGSALIMAGMIVLAILATNLISSPPLLSLSAFPSACRCARSSTFPPPR